MVSMTAGRASVKPGTWRREASYHASVIVEDEYVSVRVYDVREIKGEILATVRVERPPGKSTADCIACALRLAANQLQERQGVRA